MNYGQTAIGEVRVIANYLGINPWEFESPFVLAILFVYQCIWYIVLWRFVTREYFSQKNIEFESPFVLRKNKIYEVICMYLTLEIRYSLQTKRFVGVRISFCPSYLYTIQRMQICMYNGDSSLSTNQKVCWSSNLLLSLE